MSIIKDTRQDFADGKANLELFEKKAVEDYENDKSTCAREAARRRGFAGLKHPRIQRS